MRKILLLLLVLALCVGCASRGELKETCLRSKRLYIDNGKPTMEDVNGILNYCLHAIDANPRDVELLSAYKEMYLKFYNEDGSPKE